MSISSERRLGEVPRLNDGLHTIPVPRGWTPEQAWQAIKDGILLKDPHPFWANIIVKNGKFVELLEKHTDEEVLVQEEVEDPTAIDPNEAVDEE
jgi:hypothetical protein